MEITDLESLKAACRRLGFQFKEGQEKYKWYGHSVGDYPLPEGVTEEELGKCEHAISVPGAEMGYEIGVVRKGNGFVLRWDFYDDGLKLALGGESAKVLKQAYAVERSKRLLKRQGYNHVHERALADGSVRLQVEGT